jgi:hypothetical protein
LNGGVAWTTNTVPIKPGWLLCSADTGVCPAQGSNSLQLIFDATEKDTGEYSAALIINSNDPFHKKVTVPVRMIVSTTAGIDAHQNIPATFALAQNYPNPFNPTTTISYQLPATCKVHLSVYDLLGRELAVLLNERKDAGRYSVQWDATKMSSGIYFYRLQAGQLIETKKMILMK